MYVIAYDIGTTGVKTCLIDIEDDVRIIASEYGTYNLYVLDNGGAEQDTNEWWDAMCKTTHALMDKTLVKPTDIKGISFCSQMQGLVLVDCDGNALRRPMSYMDQRAGREMKDTQEHGITVSGVNIIMLLKSLIQTTAASTSVKDPLWKYKWVQANEPEIFKKVYKWLDVKEYLICRLTGECVMTYDSAYSTFLLDSRKNKMCWSKSLCKMYGVDYNHLPRLVKCTDIVGPLREKQATELGLAAGIPVYGSGGDATLIGVGAGATNLGDTHLYWGTSGWVGTVLDKQVVDIVSMIAGIVGAQDDKYNYFAEMETAGKCYEWVRDNLILGNVDVNPTYITEDNISKKVVNNVYDHMSDMVKSTKPGAGGVVFTPWLHGNRCPFEDPNAAGMFFNLKLETTKAELVRATVEGICYHLRWMLECEDKKVVTSKKVRFVGGGAVAPVICQVLADVTGRTVETVNYTKDVGSLGAAMLIAVDTGKIDDLSRAGELIKPLAVYEPKAENTRVYDAGYKVFKRLYSSNKKNFAMLNRLV